MPSENSKAYERYARVYMEGRVIHSRYPWQWNACWLKKRILVNLIKKKRSPNWRSSI